MLTQVITITVFMLIMVGIPILIHYVHYLNTHDKHGWKKCSVCSKATDPIFYYLPLWYVSNKKKTNKKFRPWLFRIMIIDIIINTGLLIYAFTSVSLKNFVIMVYYPGMFFLAFSVFLPLIMKETIEVFFEKEKEETLNEKLEN